MASCIAPACNLRFLKAPMKVPAVPPPPHLALVVVAGAHSDGGQPPLAQQQADLLDLRRYMGGQQWGGS